MNEYAKIIGFKCTGLAFLSTVSLGLFWELAHVLIQVSKINKGALQSAGVRWNQLVVTVDQVYRVYMHAEMMCYNMI